MQLKSMEKMKFDGQNDFINAKWGSFPYGRMKMSKKFGLFVCRHSNHMLNFFNERAQFFLFKNLVSQLSKNSKNN